MNILNKEYRIYPLFPIQTLLQANLILLKGVLCRIILTNKYRRNRVLMCSVMSSHVQLFATLWGTACQCPLDFSARILEWVAISSSRGSSWPRDQTRIEGVTESKYHHFANPNELGLGNKHQWLLKLLGEMVICNRWVRLITPETA